MAEQRKKSQGNRKGQEYKLSIREQKFVAYYLDLGDAAEAVVKAKFNTTSPAHYARKLLAKPKIQNEVARQWDLFMNERIASSQEILGFQTMVMRGLVKDQFGLEATLKDRLDASKELAKRQIDAQQVAAKGEANAFTIKLCWDRNEQPEEMKEVFSPEDDDLLEALNTDDLEDEDGNE